MTERHVIYRERKLKSNITLSPVREGFSPGCATASPMMEAVARAATKLLMQTMVIANGVQDTIL
jgi:hypothetical protein